MANWKVTVDFIDEDGEENWETVEVEALDDDEAEEVAKQKVQEMCDVDEITDVAVQSW